MTTNKYLKKATRDALKNFNRIVADKKLAFAVSFSNDDWRCRHSWLEGALKACDAPEYRVCHVHCPQVGIAAFVTFLDHQGEPTDQQIIQALRLKLIEQMEG